MSSRDLGLVNKPSLGGCHLELETFLEKKRSVLWYLLYILTSVLVLRAPNAS